MIKCYACLAELEDDRELRYHLKVQRDEERALGRVDPRGRLLLALMGNEHDTIGVDVTRRAIGDKANETVRA